VCVVAGSDPNDKVASAKVRVAFEQKPAPWSDMPCKFGTFVAECPMNMPEFTGANLMITTTDRESTPVKVGFTWKKAKNSFCLFTHPAYL